MAIEFNAGGVINLKPIPIDDVRDEVFGMLIEGEECALAFKTVRDQLIFTNKRIISVDVQGFTGRRKSYATLPYSKIQYFTVQSPGFDELISDSELTLAFADGKSATFEFKGKTDIGWISRVIAQYVL